MRKQIGVIVAFSALVVSGACSGSSGTAARRPVVHGGVRVPPAQLHPVGAYRDLTVRSCTGGPGRVIAQGSITNHSGGTDDFVLLMRWVTPTGRATDAAVIRGLAPGKSRKWVLSATVAGDHPASCAPEVRRGKLA